MTFHKYEVRMESPFVRRQKTRQQVEQDLLKAVEEAKRRYDRLIGTARDGALQQYEMALRRFNDVILNGKRPED